MLLNLIALILGFGAALLTYFLTPMCEMFWAYGFLVIPMAFGYGLAIFALYVICFFSWGMMHSLETEVKKPRMFAYWSICEIIWWLFGFLWVKAKIVGEEKIPTDRRFMMVSNHQSMFDFLIVFAKLGKYGIIPIAKKELLHFPIVGRVSHYTGLITVDRENPVKGLRAILQAIKFLKNDYCSIYVAPEGTRNKDGKMSPFHAGSFKIAEKTKCPIVVSCVTGTPGIHKNFFRRVTHVSLEFLETIPSEEVAKMNTVEMAEKCQQIIQARLDEIEAADEKE